MKSSLVFRIEYEEKIMKLNKRNFAYASVVGVAFMFAAGSAVAAPVTIDDFTTPQDTLKAEPGQTLSSAVSGANIIGGSRALTVSATAGAPPLGTTAAVMQVNNFLSFSNDVGVTGQLQVEWNAGGTGLGGIDLTDAGTNDGFLVDITTADNDFSLSFEVDDALGGTSTFSSIVPELSGPGSLPLFIAFGVFNGNADFTSIDSIRMTLTSVGAALDMSIASISSVAEIPIPGAIPLMLSGLAGLGFAGRRSGRRAA